MTIKNQGRPLVEEPVVDGKPTLEELVDNRRKAELTLAAARLESGLDQNEFVDLIDELVDCVEFEAIARWEIKHGSRDAMAAPNIRTKLMDVAGEAEIKKRLAAAPRSETGKLRQGWAAMVGAELGYTVQQVQSVIHKLKKDPSR